MSPAGAPHNANSRSGAAQLALAVSETPARSQLAGSRRGLPGEASDLQAIAAANNHVEVHEVQVSDG